MATSSTCTLNLQSVIRGHHVFKRVWTPFVGEVLSLAKEVGNPHNQYAIAVQKKDRVVGRVPIELSRVFWNFISRGGDIHTEIAEKRK